MPDRLSIHAPTLVNTIGHAAGAMIFGILLYLFFVDWRRNRCGRRVLPSVAAALALLWNLGSMVGLGTDRESGFFADLIIALSFSVLSFLPAVLLHISAGDSKWLVRSGYVVSLTAAALHFADLITGSARYHYAAVLVITIGFGALTAGVVIVRRMAGPGGEGNRRLAGAMVLFLFAISFAHFGQHDGGRAWSGEVALHHAGLPLALFVLLQDYRFLLLDTFIRFLVNAGLAGAAIGVVVLFGIRFDPLHEMNARPFIAGLFFVGGCVFLILFGSIRRRTQDLVTRLIFLRANAEKTAVRIQELAAQETQEERFLAGSAKLIAEFIGCDQFEWNAESGVPLPAWVRTSLPVTFARGDQRVLLLGARRGGRMYLSEDLNVLERLLLEVARQVDSLRAAEMQALLATGELKALQAQINPHFLFNTLNTIYGAIQRDNLQARGLILDLSDILRYSLSNDRPLIRLEDEMRIVRSYLEIERVRLGPRLQTSIEVNERANDVEIPAFSIQPLVENAVKHGAAIQAGTGYVRVSVKCEDERLLIAISNSGGFRSAPERKGNGLALHNVRRRLAICYGGTADFRIEGDVENTTVRFEVPVKMLAVR